MVMMQSAIVDLLATASETLRRIRGARSIQKAHTGLEDQLRAMTLGRAREWKAETKEVKQETREEVEEGTKEEKDPDQELRRIQKAATLVHEGHVRKAVRSLFTEGVPSLTEDTMRSLRELHPQGPPILPRCPSDAPEMMRIDKKVLAQIVNRELANGSAPGRSGWTGDLLKALVDDRECLEGLAALTMAIINGKIEGRARDALLCSVLIGLEKPGGGTRPIAMGEMFYKLAATYALRIVGETAREVLGPTQFALAPGGSEAAVLYLRTALTEHPTWTVMACDIKNAFNSRSRSDILNILYQQKGLSSIWRLADWAYGKPSDLLLVDRGRLKGTIPSTQGVKQGDTLSSLLFALSMTKLYGDTAEVTGVKTVAVQDDVYFLGPMSSVAKAWDHFNKEVGKGTGLVLNQRKTHVLTPQGADDEELVARGLQTSNLMIPALGTILTRDSGVLQKWLAKEMQGHTNDCSMQSDIRSSQYKWHLPFFGHVLFRLLNTGCEHLHQRRLVF